MKIAIVAALARNRVIGKNNRLPWRLPRDRRHFRELTMGKPVIMGRKTFASIGKALPGRKNIILTRDLNFRAEGGVVVHSSGEALKSAEGSEEVMIIGGAEIYREFLPLAERMYLTLIHADFEGDAYFPKYDPNEWQEKERHDFPPDDENPYPYSFVLLERK